MKKEKKREKGGEEGSFGRKERKSHFLIWHLFWVVEVTREKYVAKRKKRKEQMVLSWPLQPNWWQEGRK